MHASDVLRTARHRAGLTLRELAGRAGTSHSTLAAYETGSKTPTVATLDRIVRAAGFAADVHLSPRQRGRSGARRGDEILAVLELAAEFPAAHSARLNAPIFGRPTDS